MLDLKPCPFCGGHLRITTRIKKSDSEYVDACCTVCGMRFAHDQEFAFSAAARVALTPSFEDAWNNRRGEKTMDKEALLEKYIAENFEEWEPLTEEQKAAIANTMAFGVFCLREAVDGLWGDIWQPFEDVLLKNFPFMRSADAEPSTDTVEVVRCKDCKHLFFKDLSAFCPYSVGCCKPDDFCSYGERKEGRDDG